MESLRSWIKLQAALAKAVDGVVPSSVAVGRAGEDFCAELIEADARQRDALQSTIAAMKRTRVVRRQRWRTSTKRSARWHARTYWRRKGHQL